MDELAAYGAGTALDQYPGLQALATQLGPARRLAREALAAVGDGLADAPLAAWPDRHFTNGVLHSLTLAASGRASLSLALVDGAARRLAGPAAASAVASFQPGELHAIVLAGTAEAALLRNRSADPASARIESTPLPLAAGTAYACDGAIETLALGEVPRFLLTLRVHRRAEDGTPARQYDLASGALLGQAAGAQRDSRAEMIMALLRAMGRGDAAAAVAALTLEGGAGARWQALRECLALDSGTGFAALLRIAAKPDDPLAAPAAALVDRLAAGHPAFAAAREALSCPA